MKNPFNPDHHAIDKYPELHFALSQLREHRKRVIAEFGEHANEVHGAASAIGEVLAACPNCECSECGAICCPHGDEMHFHHDGCPSC